MISQKEIAEAVKLAPSTVAHILNETPNLRYSAETRERVRKAAEKFGYRPNRASRAIRRKRSNLIGIIDFSARRYETARQMATCLTELVASHGYEHMVIDLSWHAGKVERVLDEVIQMRTEGALLLAPTLESFGAESQETLKRAGIPAAFLDGEHYLKIPGVANTARADFFSMARHLQSVGHRSLLLPALVMPGYNSSSGRTDGLQLALEGLGPCFVLNESEFFQSWPGLSRKVRGQHAGFILQIDPRSHNNDIAKTYHALSLRLFATGVLPDALMCTNDQAAFGAFTAAFESKVRVPEDIALTGADNDAFGEYPLYRLTTVRPNILDSCRAAVDLLVETIRHGSCKKPARISPSELVLRQSCGRIVGPGEAEVV